MEPDLRLEADRVEAAAAERAAAKEAAGAAAGLGRAATAFARNAARPLPTGPVCPVTRSSVRSAAAL
jgi:hypothetical protein